MDLPLQLQTAYQELVQLHSAEPPLEIDGSIINKIQGGSAYWIVRKRNGDQIKDRSLGPDSNETRALVAKAKRQQAAHKPWSRAAAASVAALRAGRCLAPDMQTGRLLAQIARTGFFKSGGLLGGTQAFRHYPLMLGVEAPTISYLQTGDVDLLASRSVRLEGSGPGLATRLQEIGIPMQIIFSLDADQPPKWQVGPSLQMEFLSPVAHGGASSHNHAGIGERVQALKYLEYSLDDHVNAVSLYRSGVSIRVPSPERYALHKLLVAQLRSGDFREKRTKDFGQAEWLVSILADRRPYELWSAWDDLHRRGPKWRNLLNASFKERPSIRAILATITDVFGAVGT